MFSNISITWSEAASALWKMDIERQAVLKQIMKLRDEMKKNTEGFTGSEADRFRREMAARIGSEEFNGEDTLKSVYKRINELNYTIKNTIKEAASLANADLGGTSFDGSLGITQEEGAAAWNFVWSSNTENLNLFTNEQLVDNLGAMRSALSEIDYQMGQYLIDLQKLIDGGFSTGYNEELRSKGNDFGNIEREAARIVESEIKQIEELADKLWSTVKNFGSNVSNI